MQDYEDYSTTPFPPFVMNGPNFHAPMNIRINAIPHSNPRTSKNPYNI